MEIKISTNQILGVLKIVAWVLFIGLCIEAGAFVVSPFLPLLFNTSPGNYPGLTDLYAYDRGHFAAVLILVSIPAILKAILFYLIVKLLTEQGLNMIHPFNESMQRFLQNAAYLTLGIGLFIYWAAGYMQWLTDLGVKMPDRQKVHLDGGDVWLFMSVTLYIIAQLFKRGVIMQSENELTV